MVKTVQGYVLFGAMTITYDPESPVLPKVNRACSWLRHILHPSFVRVCSVVIV